ncbi:MAG: HIT family protein [Candidatus Zixiibacteriota bacterium]
MDEQNVAVSTVMQERTSDVDCEFCVELDSPIRSRFARVYGETLASRVICETESFVALPTIGQLFKSSLLVLPKQHVETISSLEARDLKHLISLIDRLAGKVSTLGFPIVFEHGAKCGTGHGCGIYHAHVHIVPVPSQVDCGRLLGRHCQDTTDLIDAWLQLRNADNYLVARDTHGSTGLIDLRDSKDSDFPSQYMRRRLAELYGVQKSWDWRSYQTIEPWLIETVHKLRVDRSILHSS